MYSLPNGIIDTREPDRTADRERGSDGLVIEIKTKLNRIEVESSRCEVSGEAVFSNSRFRCRSPNKIEVTRESRRVDAFRRF